MPFRTRRDILPPAQKKLWPLMAPLKDLGYCLYGGTALALRFGHRRSMDFDFFTERTLDRKALETALTWFRGGTVLRAEPDTHVLLAAVPRSRREVKVSFFSGLRIGRVGAPDLSDDGVILVASVRDLLATKLKVLFDRVEPKDYLDIAEILSRGGDLPQGLSDGRAIFGKSFSPAECLRILCWFGEPGLGSLPAGCRRTLETRVKAAWNKRLPPSRKAASSLT
ncbi:MAG TPA: nucleotidyl transferase AbiEii/AbiGii toxin family protein [Terriglobales bacterium]|nr:nucleotidyl transferase AbiEii/AbiGii toxin family protein [Terriglobales bacterium]